MERDSNKHAQWVDERLDRETKPLREGAPTESRAEDEFVQQIDVPAEPDSILSRTGDEPSPTHGEVEARSELARWLRPSEFPAERDRLLTTARARQAPDAIVTALSRLPDDVTYPTVERVWEALGHRGERRF